MSLTDFHMHLLMIIVLIIPRFLQGLAALHLASLHGRLACVKLLIEKFKHDVNLPSSTGWRPIHLAISNQTGKNSFAVLQYLLNKGADFSV